MTHGDEGEPFRVLVVDDSPVVRELIAVNLRLEGLEVVCAGDGLAALEAVAEVRPHVITLDVMMPRLDGFETVQRLRADDATGRIPVIVVSGRSQAADLARGEDLGVDAYFSKPFEPAELVEEVLRLAESGRPARSA